MMAWPNGIEDLGALPTPYQRADRIINTVHSLIPGPNPAFVMRDLDDVRSVLDMLRGRNMLNMIFPGVTSADLYLDRAADPNGMVCFTLDGITLATDAFNRSHLGLVAMPKLAEPLSATDANDAGIRSRWAIETLLTMIDKQVAQTAAVIARTD